MTQSKVTAGDEQMQDVRRRLRQAENQRDNALAECDRLRAALRLAVDAWPAFVIDDDINGGDFVTWFGEWLPEASAALREGGAL